MLKKIVKVKNIGRFRNCSASGDVEFRHMTLIYAENGRGKTTFCDILQSLRTGDSGCINGRRTLGSPENPEVEIRLDTNNTIFRGGSWNAIVPNICIFDMRFVNQNVYAGNIVEHEQKKSLLRVMVGEEGVVLTQRVSDLDQLIRDANKDIATKKDAVEKYIPEGMSLEEFLTLDRDNDIDRKIQAAEEEVDSLVRASEIISRGKLNVIVLPVAPGNFYDVLRKQLSDVSQDAETILNEHINGHTAGASEAWLADGLAYIKDEACPFCARSLEGNKLTDIYRTYFGASYASLKTEIRSLQKEVAVLFGQESLLKIQKTIKDNEGLYTFWKQFVSHAEPVVDFDSDIKIAFNNYCEKLQEHVSRKLGTPPETVDLGEDFGKVFGAYTEANTKVDRYNTAANEINGLIDVKKASTTVGNLPEAKRALERCKAKKKRYEPQTIEECRVYLDAVSLKDNLVLQKDRAKDELDKYTEAVLPAYERRMNELLRMFNAGFRIGNTTREYKGSGAPRASYQIIIDGEAVTLDNVGDSSDRAYFGNTLSTGDRSTLALAFFVAQMERDPALAQRIIVFDDPFTSQDRSRRTCTQQLITNLASKSKQVIVLSHDPYFLKLIWDNMSRSDIKTIQISRIGRDSIITEWDIDDSTRDEYAKNHQILTKYCGFSDGDPSLVVKTIRPVLEHYLRVKFPGMFLPNEWLGDFINRIRDADTNTPLHAAQSILQELQAINDYSKRYHHGDGQMEIAHIDDNELVSYVQRTLELVGGF